MNIPTKMKAVVKSEAGYDNMSLQEIPVPEVKGKQVLMKVAYTGIVELIFIHLKENMRMQLLH